MILLKAKRIYLTGLEREHCRKLYEDFEYDFQNPTEPMYIGGSIESSEKWYDEIQNDMDKHIRLGIFLLDGTVIGDVALQNIDWKNRKCDIGMGFSKIEYRNKGYGQEVLSLVLDYAFNNMGLWRVEASTQGENVPAQKILLKFGFVLEGTQRQARYWGGKYHDRLMYGKLAKDGCANVI